ncbi:hypothetical protein JOD02_001589 [Caldicoprobacter guelmensis]|uniref:hypothetical protein n=1 Tax=Caldicoprobacter guelmensis TaxID=1170224 RepID=UPI00195E3305|nr:hypothetical protein [Caldicoprobacter guelmensis]MBM7582732.1 hypothetical protein [Caldicoprobacter guelmensis]
MRDIVLGFLNKQGKMLFERKLTAIPLKEEVIILRSIEYFNDPEPCMIHRSAVMKRIFMEFGEFLNQNIEKGKFELLWDEIPEELRKIIDINGDIEGICIKIR